MKLISVVTPCYNEQDNVRLAYEEVKKRFTNELKNYKYEHIFVDNNSTDNTQNELRKLAGEDSNVKIILNARNFGHIRSPVYGTLQAQGDAVVWFVADLQDPADLIVKFVKKWEDGFKMVLGVKVVSEESSLFFAIRKMYYNLVTKLSDVELVKNFTGFGLYDKSIVEIIRKINDPYPYFRGLICDIGFEKALIPYQQPVRKRGITKNNFFTLFDIAMLGITSHSKVPLRLATMIGFTMGAFSFLISILYLIIKLIRWDSMQLGLAPLVIGLFFFSSVQLFFIGIIGEYIGNIHTQVLKRPLIVEKERINF